MSARVSTSAAMDHPGRLDTRFDPVPNGSPELVITTPRTVIIGGGFTEIDGSPRPFLAGLTPEGDLDPRFDASEAPIRRGVLARDDDVLYVEGRGGLHANYDSIYRLNLEGQRVPGFDPEKNGVGINADAILPIDGGLLVAGGFYFSDENRHFRGIVRLTQSGGYDPSFDDVAIDSVRVMAIAGKRLVVGGGFTEVNGQAYRKHVVLDTDGRLHPTWNPGPGFPEVGTVEAIVAADLGAYIVAGSFSSVHGEPRGNIAKILENGSVSPDFGMMEHAVDGKINAMVVQSDGKIVIGGEFRKIGNRPRGRLARLARDGSLDSSFDTGETEGRISGLALQESRRGRFLIAVGRIRVINGKKWHDIARIGAGDGPLAEQEGTPVGPEEEGISDQKKTKGDLPSMGKDTPGTRKRTP